MAWDGISPPRYQKPHLTFDQQIDLLSQRGLAIPNRDRALAALQVLGYYRLAAYLYPLRMPLDAGERAATPTSYRKDTFVPGATFDEAVALSAFDRKLRLTVLQATELIEISLRTKVAYVLGASDPFGHLRRESLNEEACARRREGSDVDAFCEWLDLYGRLQSRAEKEDFVRHHLHKYREPLPIWIAIEFLDFGAVTRLHSLMAKSHREEVARMHGVKGGGVFTSWIKQLNYLRNTAAHHSRMWNRTLLYPAARWNEHQVPQSLTHAASCPRDKMYVPLAIAGALVRQIDPTSDWPRSLRTVVRKFPAVPNHSPESDMGFPQGWAELPLWSDPPQASP